MSVERHLHKGTDSPKISHKDLLDIDPDKNVHDDRYLNKENTGAFTPDADYEPATKKYVDDKGVEKTKKAYTAGEGIKAGDAIFIADGNESAINMVESNDVSPSGNWGKTTEGHIAQSFQFVRAQKIASLVVKLGKAGSPTDNVQVGIQADDSDKPSGTFLGSQTFAGSGLAALAEKTITLDVTVSITAATKYWIVIKRSGSLHDTNYYLFAHSSSNSYANGALKNSTDGSTWGTAVFGDDDSHFRFPLSFTAGKSYLTRADVGATAMAHGIAEDTVATDAETDLITNGISTIQSGLTAGLSYYTQATPGSIGTTVAAYENFVGVALSATSLLLVIREAILDVSEYGAGDTLIEDADTERSTTTIDAPGTKLKEIRIDKGGTLRIKFDLKRVGGTDTTAYARIYKNGVAHGTLQSTTSTTYVTKSEDIGNWEGGDLIQLQVWRVTNGPTCYVENFRIYTDQARQVLEVITN